MLIRSRNRIPVIKYVIIQLLIYVTARNFFPRTTWPFPRRDSRDLIFI